MIQSPDAAPDSLSPVPVDPLGRDEVPRAEQIQNVVLDIRHVPLVGEEQGKHFYHC